jgi:hypothetical protein
LRALGRTRSGLRKRNDRLRLMRATACCGVSENSDPGLTPLSSERLHRPLQYRSGGRRQSDVTRPGCGCSCVAGRPRACPYARGVHRSGDVRWRSCPTGPRLLEGASMAPFGSGWSPTERRACGSRCPRVPRTARLRRSPSCRMGSAYSRGTMRSPRRPSTARCGSGGCPMAHC